MEFALLDSALGGEVSGKTFKPGDRVFVIRHQGCKPNATATVTELRERLHPADGSLIRQYWVRFDEIQGDPADWLPSTGPRFVECTVHPLELRNLTEGDTPSAESV